MMDSQLYDIIGAGDDRFRTRTSPTHRFYRMTAVDDDLFDQFAFDEQQCWNVDEIVIDDATGKDGIGDDAVEAEDDGVGAAERSDEDSGHSPDIGLDPDEDEFMLTLGGSGNLTTVDGICRSIDFSDTVVDVSGSDDCPADSRVGIRAEDDPPGLVRSAGRGSNASTGVRLHQEHAADETDVVWTRNRNAIGILDRKLIDDIDVVVQRCGQVAAARRRRRSHHRRDATSSSSRLGPVASRLSRDVGSRSAEVLGGRTATGRPVDDDGDSELMCSRSESCISWRSSAAADDDVVDVEIRHRDLSNQPPAIRRRRYRQHVRGRVAATRRPGSHVTDTDDPTTSSAGHDSLFDQTWDAYQDPPYAINCYDSDEEKLDASALVQSEWRHSPDNDEDFISSTSATPIHSQRQSPKRRNRSARLGSTGQYCNRDTSDDEDLQNVIEQSRKALHYSRTTMADATPANSHYNSQLLMEEHATCQTNIECLTTLLEAMKSGNSTHEDISNVNDLLRQWYAFQSELVTKYPFLVQNVSQTYGDERTSSQSADPAAVAAAAAARHRTASETSCNTTVVDETRHCDFLQTIQSNVDDIRLRQRKAGTDIESLKRRVRRDSVGQRLRRNLTSTPGVLPAVVLMLLFFVGICFINYYFGSAWQPTHGISINPRFRYVMGPPPT